MISQCLDIKLFKVQFFILGLTSSVDEKEEMRYGHNKKTQTPQISLLPVILDRMKFSNNTLTLGLVTYFPLEPSFLSKK